MSINQSIEQLNQVGKNATSGKLREQLIEQQKLIYFMQLQYKQNTGYNVTVPQEWSKYLNSQILDNSIQQQNQLEVQTQKQQQQLSQTYSQQFSQKQIDDMQQQFSKTMYDQEKDQFSKVSFIYELEKLQLPKKLSGDIKKRQVQKGGKEVKVTTNYSAANAYHNISVINLSGFENKNIQKQEFNTLGLKQLIESITDMPHLNTLVLQNNGMEDIHCEELEILMSIKKLCNLDFSRNYLGKKFVQRVNRIMREAQHYEWLDFSRNQFSYDPSSIQMFIQALKGSKNLNHLCLSANFQFSGEYEKDKELLEKFQGSDIIAKSYITCQSISSLFLIDSNINELCIQSLCNFLSSNQYYHQLTSLSLKYCYLDKNKLQQLCENGINKSKHLVHLDLSNNGIEYDAGLIILESIKECQTLYDLNLSNNHLGDSYIKQLCKQLMQIENNLWKIDLSGNPIQEQGALFLLDLIENHNFNLESFGNIQINRQMGVGMIQKILKALEVNKYYNKNKIEIQRNLQNQILSTEEKFSILSNQNIKDEARKQFFEGDQNNYNIISRIEFVNNQPSNEIQFSLWNI